MARAKQADKVEPPMVEKSQVAEKKVVRVKAKMPPFVDLITDRKIGPEYEPCDWHPWLQAQIDAGLLIEEQ